MNAEECEKRLREYARALIHDYSGFGSDPKLHDARRISACADELARLRQIVARLQAWPTVPVDFKAEYVKGADELRAALDEILKIQADSKPSTPAVMPLGAHP